MTNYLTYVKGTRGKADPKKSKVYIGWVNQQGGQVVIGGLATAGAELAVKYVNDQLGGVGGHPVALVECFIKSNEEEGTTCGQKLVNDKRINVIATGAVATGAQSLFATIRGAKPVVTGVATTPGRRSAEERRSSSSATRPTSSCPSARTRGTSSRPRQRQSSIRRRRASRRRR